MRMKRMERVFSMNPYSVEDFLVAHHLLTHDLVKHPGQFRLSDVGVYDASGRVIHVGARPQFVPGLVEELFSWAKNSDLLDLVKSCLVHFELEIIHPFGRREWSNGPIVAKFDFE